MLALAFALGSLLTLAALLCGLQIGWRMAQRVAPVQAVADAGHAVRAAVEAVRPGRAETVTEQDEFLEEQARDAVARIQAEAARQLQGLNDEARPAQYARSAVGDD